MIPLAGKIHGIRHIYKFKLHLIQQHNRTVDIRLCLTRLGPVFLEAQYHQASQAASRQRRNQKRHPNFKLHKDAGNYNRRFHCGKNADQGIEQLRQKLLLPFQGIQIIHPFPLLPFQVLHIPLNQGLVGFILLQALNNIRHLVL